jgi:hypothetical protein
VTDITPHLDPLDNDFNPVGSQGRRNTCLPLSITMAHQIVRGDGHSLSAEALWQHAYMAGHAVPEGTSVSAMRSALLDQGQPLEAEWPYDGGASDPQAPPASLMPPPWTTAELEPRPANHQDVIQALLADQPVVVVMDLSNEFTNPHEDVILDPPVGAPSLGFHAVVAVQSGHDGSRYWVLLRNSWGPRWGRDGRAWVSEDHLAARMLSADVVAASALSAT